MWIDHDRSSDDSFSLEEKETKHDARLGPYITPEGRSATLSGAGFFKTWQRKAGKSLHHLGLHFAERVVIDSAASVAFAK